LAYSDRASMLPDPKRTLRELNASQTLRFGHPAPNQGHDIWRPWMDIHCDVDGMAESQHCRTNPLWLSGQFGLVLGFEQMQVPELTTLRSSLLIQLAYLFAATTSCGRELTP
jgi:hypothetical protein